MYYAWSVCTDEIKIFRHKYNRDRFVEEHRGDWFAVSKEDLQSDCPDE